MEDIPNSAANGNGGDKPGGPGATVVIPPEKRGRGRPPGSSNKPKTPALPATREDSPPIDPGLVGDLFVSLSEIGDDFFVLAILSKARTKLPPEYYQKFVVEMDRVRLGEKDKRLIREGAIALAKKYTFLLHWGPEIILLVCAVQYGARMANCYRKISALPDQPPKRVDSGLDAPKREVSPPS